MSHLVKKILDALTSLKLAVICLCLLSVLVFCGTLYQVDHGLYAAKKEYFYSWFLMLFGFVPFPGGMLVQWVLFVNLFLSMMIHFRYGWRKLGAVLIHAGILLMLAGGWVTHKYGEEFYLLLPEGDASNLASSYHDWELSIWPVEEDQRRKVTALDAGRFESGYSVRLSEPEVTLFVEAYHPNCRAFVDDPRGGEGHYHNASRINLLMPQSIDKEPGANTPGAQLRLQETGGAEHKILLYGQEARPTTITVGDNRYALQLRRQRTPLPMVIQLIDFRKEFHPNTQSPKSFSSKINVMIHDLERQVLVEMNRPFRHSGFTFFQASYIDGEDGLEASRFAVTRNQGRLVPYVATGITVVGLILHFLVELYRPRKPLRVTQ